MFKRRTVLTAILLLCGFSACLFMAFKNDSFALAYSQKKRIDGKSKTLILFRHAKSSHENTSIPDFDRPLDTSGLREASEMGEFLRHQTETVDLIVASPAKRTHQTADIICRYLNYRPENIRWDSTLYLCTKETLIASIRKTDAKIRTVVFIGHNPSMTSTANALQPDTTIAEVKTAGIVAIDYEQVKWSEVGKTKGKLIFYKKPD